MKAAYARRLTINDLSELIRVFDSRSTLMKNPLTDEKRHQQKEDAEKQLREYTDLIVYWGAFSEDHKLCSYLVQEFSLIYPRWYLKILVTEESFSLRPLNMRHSGLGLCIDKAIAGGEAAGYFEWLYSVVPDRFGTRAKIWTSQSASVARYIFLVDSAFRPDETPVFSYQKTLVPETVIRNKTWIIKKAVLKPEHRFDILNKQGKLDLTYKEAYNE
jgi:hypothetical protein